jgi:hypothetical protein
MIFERLCLYRRPPDDQLLVELVHAALDPR